MTRTKRSCGRLRYAPLAVACGLLGGCKTLEAVHPVFRASPSTAAQASAAQAAPAPAVVPPAATRTANRHAPGSLHFIIEDTGWGDYHGWRIQILSAKINKGFKPLVSSPMQGGEHMRIDLWPDQYHVQVTVQNNLVYDGLVEIKADLPTVVQVRISMLRNSVDILDGAASEQAAQSSSPTRQLHVRQTFDPLPVMLIPGIDARYDGPRENNAPVGKGRLTLHKNDERIAVVEEAVVQEDGKLTGKPSFDDGRQIENYDIADGDVPSDAVTRYKDGREFRGAYESLSPKDGVMTYPDGRRWTGSFNDDAPQGAGALGMEDGTIVEGVPGMDPSVFDGSYDCVSPKGRKASCHYFEGKQVKSEAEYKKMVGWRSDTLADAVKQVEELAAATAANEQAARQAGPATPVPPPVAPATATAPIDGCSALNGQFATSTNLSKIRFDGNGRGYFWQATYGGSTRYFFEVNFAYQGSRDSVQFTYDQAVYKDAGGQVIRHQSMPGGSSACSFNGRVLNIGGTEYLKQ